MSRYVRVSDNNYKVTVNSGGTITLDTGVEQGTVVVTGNLLVKGNTTAVESEELKVRDNIIILNDGETGAGVTLGTAGIEIKRGTALSAQILYLENEDRFAFKYSDGTLIGLRTNEIIPNGNDNLQLLGAASYGVVSVSGTTDYELNINDDDDIPNVKWVQDWATQYFIDNPPEFIKKQDSILQIVDGAETVLRLTLDGAIKAEFRPTFFDLQQVRITDNIITTNIENADLVLTADGFGNVAVNDSLKFVITGTTPASTTDSVKVYSANEAYGGTGLFFVNNKNNRDELISKRKAIAYSMIF